MRNRPKTLKTVLAIASGFFIAFIIYSLYVPVIYRYAPRAQAVIEHVTHYPPGLCRVLNVKALRGSGDLRWVVVHDKRTGKTTEHVRAYKNGKAIDLACPGDTCEEVALCKSITVANYGISPGAAQSPLCRVDNYDLKNRLFLKYLDAALKVDRALDRM
jgi:hypothetical protein